MTSGFSDTGAGQYTTLAVAAADATGLRIDQIDVRIGGTELPTGAVSGGSWTAASSASAVMEAGEALKGELLKAAGRTEGSRLKGARPEFVVAHLRSRAAKIVLLERSQVPLVAHLRRNSQGCGLMFPEGG